MSLFRPFRSRFQSREHASTKVEKTRRASLNVEFLETREVPARFFASSMPAPPAPAASAISSVRPDFEHASSIILPALVHQVQQAISQGADADVAFKARSSFDVDASPPAPDLGTVDTLFAAEQSHIASELALDFPARVEGKVQQTPFSQNSPTPATSFSSGTGSATLFEFLNAKLQDFRQFANQNVGPPNSLTPYDAPPPFFSEEFAHFALLSALQRWDMEIDAPAHFPPGGPFGMPPPVPFYLPLPSVTAAAVAQNLIPPSTNTHNIDLADTSMAPAPLPSNGHFIPAGAPTSVAQFPLTQPSPMARFLDSGVGAGTLPPANWRLVQRLIDSQYPLESALLAGLVIPEFKSAMAGSIRALDRFIHASEGFSQELDGVVASFIQEHWLAGAIAVVTIAQVVRIRFRADDLEPLASFEIPGITCPSGMA